jgi:curli biogenesis system outer membrane secretion channel CsgG
MAHERSARTFLLAVAAIVAAGCTATVDKQSVRATQTAPESTQVDVVRIPYDPSLPYWVVTVEPFVFEADGAGTGAAPPVPGRRYGWGPFGWGLLPEGPQARAYNPPPQGASASMGGAVSSQLVTALSNVGNIRIIEYDFYVQNRARPATLVKKSQHEVGPFLIRGSVTEFNEIAEATGSSTGGSLGGVGAALGIAGAIAGNTAATVTGASVAVANPTFENTKARRTGSVAMDVKIVSPADGRLVGALVANGSFTSESSANGFSLFGFGKASNAFAASALGQANRAAMNSATTQIADRLRGVR